MSLAQQQHSIAEKQHKSSMKEVFLLVGPLGSGKTRIGKLIEREFGVPFLEYENIFTKEQNENAEDFLRRAEPSAERAIFEFLERNGKMCLENTMIRPYAHDILEKLQKIADVRMIHVSAPLDLTLQRLQRRTGGDNVRWKSEEIASMYQKSEILGLDYDLTVNNTDLSDEELLYRLRPVMEERKWLEGFVEIIFRGHVLRFCSWNEGELTQYDMEYKPWKVAFREENPGYLGHYELRPGDVVVDAGGYEGTFAIYAAKAVGETGRVIVFEPDSVNYRRLLANIELNGLTNVTVINKALWNKKKILFFTDKHTAGSSFFGGTLTGREVEAVTLDEELGRLGVQKVNFIKMDIEGSELQALRGATKTLEGDVNLAVASYHIIEGERTCTEVENILRGLGYKVETEYPQHPITFGSRLLSA
ncbi:MAG: FkbM family methyltransferase [Candidatus Marsarchaeota archaeon]|nr:FkbM family methyltransferase [Candidatus Marsarchaeota archaeon]